MAYNKPYVKTQTFFINDVEMTATAAELNKAASVTSNTAEYTVSGAIPATVQNIEISHATVVAAMTIADFSVHQGMVTIKNTSASGTAAHTVTLTAGTFDGTNDVVTLNAPGEAIILFVDSAGDGVIVENIGGVVLS